MSINLPYGDYEYPFPYTSQTMMISFEYRIAPDQQFTL